MIHPWLTLPTEIALTIGAGFCGFTLWLVWRIETRKMKLEKND